MNLSIRLFCVTMLCGLGLALTADLAKADLRYTITQLRPLSTAVGKYSSAVEINDSGIAVGMETVPGTGGVGGPPETRALQWNTDAQPTLLATPAGYVGARARTISLTGRVTGNAMQSLVDFAGTGARLDSDMGEIVDFGLPYGLPVLAGNVHGDVVGNLWRTTTVHVATADGTTLELHTGGAELHPVAINADRTVIANPIHATDRRMRLLRPNQPSRLITVEGFAPTTAIVAGDINQAGTVVANITSGTSALAAKVNSITGQKQLLSPLLPQSNDETISVSRLNDRGVAVGISITPELGQQLVRWDEAMPVNLHTKIDGLSGWTRIRPTDINNRGQILGVGDFDHDKIPPPGRFSTAFG